MIEKLFLMPNNNNIKTKIKNNPNFLLFILKNEKNPIKLLKELNLDEKEIKNLISKLPKELQHKILSKIDIKKELKLPTSNKNSSKEEKIIETLFSTFPNEIKNELHNKITQEKIIPIIKKEIEYKIKNSKITIPQKELNELKNIKTLNQLVSFAKKLNLNLKKIVISKKEEIIKLTKQELLDNKISTIEILNKKLEDKDFLTKKNRVNTQNNTSPLQKLIDNDIDNDKTSKALLPDFNNFTKNNKNNINLINTKNNLSPNKELIDYKLQKNKVTLKNLLNTNNQVKNKIDTSLLNIKSDTKDLKNYQSQNKIDTPLPDFSNKKDDKNSENILSSIQQNLSNQIHQKIISAKQTLTHFSSSLKEAIENYKPPISKISIELNPKELGKVEVTLIHRGENLQIHINSNQTQTINFFNTNQQELKNILVNMGYSEVNMSFNSNQQQKQKDTYKQNQNQFSEIENEEFIIEIPYFYA